MFFLNIRFILFFFFFGSLFCVLCRIIGSRSFTTVLLINRRGYSELILEAFAEIIGIVDTYFVGNLGNSQVFG